MFTYSPSGTRVAYEQIILKAQTDPAEEFFRVIQEKAEQSSACCFSLFSSAVETQKINTFQGRMIDIMKQNNASENKIRDILNEIDKAQGEKDNGKYKKFLGEIVKTAEFEACVKIRKQKSTIRVVPSYKNIPGIIDAV